MTPQFPQQDPADYDGPSNPFGPPNPFDMADALGSVASKAGEQKKEGMNMPLIREDLPSSGLRECVDHKWNMAGKDGEMIVLACAKCGKTILSKPETKQESAAESKSKLLMEG
jgi:hypothetical protein